MKTKNYTWCFDIEALAGNVDGSLSVEYHVPREKLGVPAGDLVHSKLWLLMRSGAEYYLFALVSPCSIEEYTEGRYKGDYLIRTDPLYSVRLLPRNEGVEHWHIELSPDDGIRECSGSEAEALDLFINKHRLAGFSEHSKKLINSIPKTKHRDLEYAVPDQMALVLRKASFGDMHEPHGYPATMSAVGCVTLSILRSSIEGLDEPKAVELISSIDPMVEVGSGGIRSPQEVSDKSVFLPPVVDTLLVDFDPDLVAPRHFVAGSASEENSWIEKTNNAEKRHEAILKDTALHLKEIGFSVLRSRSFDLYAEKQGIRILFEIKSANDDNLLAQGEKGILQLLRYAVALEGERGNRGPRYVLLLQYVNRPAILSSLNSIAKRVGIELWLYDQSLGWPDRISIDEGRHRLNIGG